MPFFHIVLLALIQGFTELLPVSSSAHLGMFHCFTDKCSAWDDENMAMDIAVHVGTLFAVLFYFWRDVVKMILGAKDIASGKVTGEKSRLVLYVITSSIPVIIAGLLLNTLQPDWLKSLQVMGWTLIIFGILLWWTDAKRPITQSIEDMNFKDAIVIGLAQTLSLVPGVSRSGITMTAARFLGYSRLESARYSMFMAMVAISGAGALIGYGLLKDGNSVLGMDVLIAIIMSFFSSWAALVILMNVLPRFSFKPFAIYRIVVGVILLGLLYSGAVGS